MVSIPGRVKPITCNDQRTTRSVVVNCGFDPWSGQTKDFKMFGASPIITQQGEREILVVLESGQCVRMERNI